MPSKRGAVHNQLRRLFLARHRCHPHLGFRARTLSFPPLESSLRSQQPPTSPGLDHQKLTHIKNMVEILNQTNLPVNKFPVHTRLFNSVHLSFPTTTHQSPIQLHPSRLPSQIQHRRHAPLLLLQQSYDLFHNADTFISFLTFQIENSFIAFGEFVPQQTIGIPTGVNDGVHLADNFLFTYEFDFFLQLINLYRIPLIHSFALTERFLDDLLSLNNPDFNKHRYDNRPLRFSFDTPPSQINPLASLVPQQRYNLRSVQYAEIQGIYPHPELKVEIEHDTTPLPFLDVQTKYDERNRLYYVDNFAKELSPKYKAIQFNRYPDIRSALVPHISSNILNTSACNFLKLSRKKDFIANVIHVMLSTLNTNTTPTPQTSSPQLLLLLHSTSKPSLLPSALPSFRLRRSYQLGPAPPPLNPYRRNLLSPSPLLSPATCQ
eukprot:g50014.t1